MMKKKHNKKSSFIILLSLPLLTSLFLQGCGKYGPPTPDDPSRSFMLSAEASPVNDCISFTGKLTGAYENMDSLRLELAPVNGPEDCPGCPFIPKDVVFFSTNDINLDQTNGDFAYAYCPRKAPAFRWRMGGISKYSSIPHILSQEQRLIMTK